MPGGSYIKHTLQITYFNKKKILDPGACEKTEVQIKNGSQTLEVSKIRGKNKKNFEKCWSSIINYFFPNRLVETSGDCEWTDNIEYTGRRQTNKGTNKITELRTILQRESPNS